MNSSLADRARRNQLLNSLPSDSLTAVLDDLDLREFSTDRIPFGFDLR